MSQWRYREARERAMETRRSLCPERIDSFRLDEACEDRARLIELVDRLAVPLRKRVPCAWCSSGWSPPGQLCGECSTINALLREIETEGE